MPTWMVGCSKTKGMKKRVSNANLQCSQILQTLLLLLLLLLSSCKGQKILGRRLLHADLSSGGSSWIQLRVQLLLLLLLQLLLSCSRLHSLQIALLRCL